MEPHANDRILREVLAELGAILLQHLLAIPVRGVRLFESQFPLVKELRADLILEEVGGNRLFHLEAQRQHEPMLGRMLMTAGALHRLRPEALIDQTVIYFGDPPCRITSELHLAQCVYRFRLIDMRQIDCARFLAASEPEAALLALLCHPGGLTPAELARAVVRKVTQGTTGQRRLKLITGLEILVSNRPELMPYLGRELAMALAIEVEELISYQWGLERGRAEGEAKGRADGEARVLLRLLERRFGQLPGWVQERVSGATAAQLEDWAERLLDAADLDEVFN